MSKTRLEWKVGLFVFLGLVLMGVLLLQFSKGASLFRSSYDILLRSSNVSGLKEEASVLVSGVRVGSVSKISLAPDGKSVTMVLTIYSQYQIHKDARFTIEQSGFLGDQFVGIFPTENKGEIFKDGDVAAAEPPFNFQEVARSASGLVQRVEQTAEELNRTMADMRLHLLNPNTLTNLSMTVLNLRAVSDRAVFTIDNLNGLLASNGPVFAHTSSNLAGFSDSMVHVSDSLNQILATNEPLISSAVQNVEASSATLRSLMDEIESGRGLAGTVIKNEELSRSVTEITRNLSLTSSNLNRLGLWGILWSRKDKTPPAPSPDKLSSPKDQPGY